MTGVYNLFLFQSQNNRPARDKLSNMGGIMSSSEELMNVAMPIINRAMTPPSPPPTPPTQSMGMQQPPPMPPAFPTMPNMRNNESVTTNPDQQNNINPSNTPVVPQQNKPMGMMAGALVPIIQGASRLAGPASRAVQPFLNTIKMGRNARPGMKDVTPPRSPWDKPDMTKKNFKFKNTPDLGSNPSAFKQFLKKHGISGSMAGILGWQGLKLLEGKNEQEKKNPSKTPEKDKEVIDEMYKTAGIPKYSDLSNAELTDEFIRVAKNTALTDPGSYADRFGKAILMGLTTRMAQLGAEEGEDSRQEYLYNTLNAAMYEQLTSTLDDPTPQQLREASQQAQRLAANAAPGAPSAREYFRRNPTHRDDGSNPAPPNTDTLTETDSDKNVTKDKVLEDLLKKYTS